MYAQATISIMVAPSDEGVFAQSQHIFPTSPLQKVATQGITPHLALGVKGEGVRGGFVAREGLARHGSPCPCVQPLVRGDTICCVLKVHIVGTQEVMQGI